MDHHCHALGCRASCPAKHLMCRKHWAMVPRGIQEEVYATVGDRSRDSVDASWAPWWRAQARAIAHVAHLEQPNDAARDLYLSKAMAFADKLEARHGRMEAT